MPIVGLIKKYRKNIKNLKCFLFLKGKLPFLSHSKEQQKHLYLFITNISVFGKSGSTNTD